MAGSTTLSIQIELSIRSATALARIGRSTGRAVGHTLQSDQANELSRTQSGAEIVGGENNKFPPPPQISSIPALHALMTRARSRAVSRMAEGAIVAHRGRAIRTGGTGGSGRARMGHRCRVAAGAKGTDEREGAAGIGAGEAAGAAVAPLHIALLALPSLLQS